MPPYPRDERRPGRPRTGRGDAHAPARVALCQILAAALGERAQIDDVLGAELVNTETEALTTTDAARDLKQLIGRAAERGEEAPMVRIGVLPEVALLVSPDHIWTLANRVDELEIALRALAVAAVDVLAERSRLEALRELLQS